MRLISIDTTGRICAAAIYDDGVITERRMDEGLTHSQTLMPAIDGLFAQTGLRISDMDAVAAVTGPGSFTGIRIGVCTAKGLAYGASLPCVAVNTLDALAYNAREHRTLVCTLLDARRGEVYGGVYDNREGGLCPLLPCGAYTLEEVLDFLSGRAALFLGDGAVAYEESIRSASEAYAIAEGDILLQSAASSAALAAGYLAAGRTLSVYDLMPSYYREFVAGVKKQV